MYDGTRDMLSDVLMYDIKRKDFNSLMVTGGCSGRPVIRYSQQIIVCQMPSIEVETARARRNMDQFDHHNAKVDLFWFLCHDFCI